MGFGDTAKRIQTLADKAEQTYKRLNDLRDEVEHTQTTVSDTGERVRALENEMAEQRAVLDAVAREVGVDLDSVSAQAHIAEAETATGDGVDTDDGTDTVPETDDEGTGSPAPER
jgi:predicted  nucleic acid-binding Zn-ribbon protein